MDTRKPTEAVFGTNMFAKNFIKYVTLLNISGKYFSQDHSLFYKITKFWKFPQNLGYLKPVPPPYENHSIVLK